MSNTAPRNQDALTFGYVSPPKPRPTFQGETLHTLTKPGRILVLDLRYHVEPTGFEVRIAVDGELVASQRCETRTAADAVATGFLQTFTRDGWQ